MNKLSKQLKCYEILQYRLELSKFEWNYAERVLRVCMMLPVTNMGSFYFVKDTSCYAVMLNLLHAFELNIPACVFLWLQPHFSASYIVARREYLPYNWSPSHNIPRTALRMILLLMFELIVGNICWNGKIVCCGIFCYPCANSKHTCKEWYWWVQFFLDL